MSEIPEVVYGDKPETIIRAAPKHSAAARNHLLLGSLMEVKEENGDWYRVSTRRKGRGGWVHKDDVTTRPALKMFFVDVGQGDGVLIESPQGIVVVDGGEKEGFHRFLRHRYAPLFDRGETIHIEAMIMSHPDADHYNGLKYILRDPDFTVGTLYHNGILRYKGIEGSIEKMKNAGALRTASIHGETAYIVSEHYDSLSDIEARIAAGKVGTWFEWFWNAALEAEEKGRLGEAKVLTLNRGFLPGFEVKKSGALRIHVLGPVPFKQTDGKLEYLAFGEPTERSEPEPEEEYGYSHSHTRNGHSIVLKLEFGKHSFLLAGDVNIPAEQHLLAHYGGQNPFRVSVAKSCHHGSSDFSPRFLEKIKPYATVVSSGDNTSFDHPMPDALGAVARYSRGKVPLVFSTELGRAYRVKEEGGTVSVSTHYGLVNARSNGKLLSMAQMKEQHKKKKDIWDSFMVPYNGRFWY